MNIERCQDIERIEQDVILVIYRDWIQSNSDSWRDGSAAGLSGRMHMAAHEL